MADLVLNRGDLYPPLEATLRKRNETTGKLEPIDLTQATAVKVFLLGPVQIEGACTISTLKTDGKVSYQWVTADTETAGVYRCQFEITWTNGKTQTVPNENYATVEIQPDLAGDA